MKSVSIVGLGWLGFPLARQLLGLGWEVKGSKRTHEGVEQMRLQRIETYHLELTPEINADPDDLTLLFDVDSLIINIPPSEYFFDVSSYIEGVKNVVIEALLQGVQHLIFISSTSVFPDIDGIFDENTVPQPTSDIGKTLLELEYWLLGLKDIDCDILRLAGLVGYDRHPVTMLAGRENISGGNQPVNLVHFEDCARAIQLLLETPSAQRLYHLSAPLHPKKADYYGKMAEKLALNPPHFICQEQDPQRIVMGNKICDELDFVYQYPDPFAMQPEQQ